MTTDNTNFVDMPAECILNEHIIYHANDFGSDVQWIAYNSWEAYFGDNRIWTGTLTQEMQEQTKTEIANNAYTELFLGSKIADLNNGAIYANKKGNQFFVPNFDESARTQAFPIAAKF